MNQDVLQEARGLLSKGKVAACIDLLKAQVQDQEMLTQIFQLEIRLGSLQNKITSGTISQQDAQLEENRISNALLLIVTNLAKPRTKAKAPAARPTVNSRLSWWIVGGLLLLLGLSVYYITTTGRQPKGEQQTAEAEAKEVDPCESIECLNGGECLNGQCKCPPGYTGDRCQNKETTAAEQPKRFKVTQVKLSASPDNHRGTCPQKITFAGVITTQGSGGEVRYRFIRSDGAKSQWQRLNFASAGSRKVINTWTLGGPGKTYQNYWQALEIAEPNAMVSEKAAFTLRCDEPAPEGFRVIEASMRAKPSNFTGDCPKRIEFSGRISVIGGSGTVSYRLIRSDGAKGPVETLTFDRPGSQSISSTWRLGGPGKTYNRYWRAIKILEPNSMESNKAYFTLKCQ